MCIKNYARKRPCAAGRLNISQYVHKVKRLVDNRYAVVADARNRAATQSYFLYQ